jgi:hypothetical protein
MIEASVARGNTQEPSAPMWARGDVRIDRRQLHGV